MHWQSLQAATRSSGLPIIRRTWDIWQPSFWLHRGFATCYIHLNKTGTTGPRNGDSIDPENLAPKKGSKVQYWIKQFPWSDKQAKADPQYPFLDEASAANVRRMKEEIDKLNGELQDMDRRLKDGSFLEPAIQKLPFEAQDETRIQIRNAAMEEAQKAKELQALLPKIEIRLELKTDKKKHLERLNTDLKEAVTGNQEQDSRMKVWQSYTRCKAFLPPFLNQISDELWDLLVKISMNAQLNNDPHWASHRITLYEDMKSTGKIVDSSQQLLYIEALSHDGQGKRAVAQWQDMRSLVKHDKTSLAHYELIGVELFTSQGNPEKAEEIAFEYLAKEPPEESRILIPILATWLERGDKIGWKHAWALYLRMKAQLGSGITMNDYDNVTMTFLRGGKTDLALAVFKDMMLAGQETGEDSLELYKKAVGLMARSQSKNITVKDFNAVALTSLTYLPKKYQNRFFYGSWLKKLLGMGETDAAAMVIELMYERGVKPDSKHMNGIIGAWLRSDKQADNDKAERMAWAMVHERLDFVNGRGGSDIKKADTILPSWVPFPTYINRGTALATIETFSLLLHYYVGLRSEQKIEGIQKVLDVAKINPDTFFMNQLLFHEVLNGSLSVVWTKYLEDFAHIRPDLETFELLWDCEKKHLERVILKQPDEYPGPRLIMREMMNWFLAPARTVKEQNRAREDFSKKMYNHILRCLCLAKDFEGVIVALYALRDAFGVYPDAGTAKMITLDIARMGLGLGEEEQAQWKPRRHRLRGNPQLKANVGKVDSLFKMIWQHRNQLLLTEHGMQQAEIDERMRQEEGLFILAEFLRNILQRITPGLGKDGAMAVEANLKKAASSMGVGGISLEDPRSSYGKTGGESKGITAASTG